MSDLPPATRGADQRIGPSNAGSHIGRIPTVTTAASSIDTGLTRGGAYITIQARGGDIYVITSATATTANTAGNSSLGEKIADGSKADYWITPGARYLDVIASASMTAFWWFSSPNYDGRP